MKRLFAALIWVFAWVGADAQPYKLLGGATALGGDCYQITKAAPNQRGVVWRNDKIKLNEPFDLEFLMNFGDRDQNGSDGMVFILQTAGNDKLGPNGRDLGFSGIFPSLGVEFDTFQNNRTGGTGYGDPEFDHIAVVSNGNGNHTTPHTLFMPVPALESGRNIEDGRGHLVRIAWNPTARELDVYFDCQQRVKLRKDLITDLFEGQTEVWWGISGSTGTAYNRHTVCLLPRTPFQSTMTVCAGESGTLTSRMAVDNQYRWFPAEGLDNPTVRSPKVRPLRPTTYTVSYRNHCGQSVTDTIRVSIATSNLELGKDTTLCEGQTLTLSTHCQNATTVLWNDGTGKATLTVHQPGRYWVRVEEAGCVFLDTVLVRLESCQEANVYIPDVFTPNGDGVNDVLTLHYSGIDSYEFFVYDRWGVVLYKGELNKAAWDGQNYPAGLYTWVVRYRFTDQKQQKHEVRKMGQVQLWR
ncbi:lectin-like domain-containing protein [Larkinella sp. VNQ87]|uniref:lectin-like domain-containing protein n=1 Tax=Larkinella sp. VNQ87 TaxID=3400921 RepID=UPI003C126F87